jgi:glycosyltransferase involved in cell wall biosynthesis
VLHLLACDDWGGTEVQVSTQAIRSSRERVAQDVAILAPPGPVHRRLVEAGVPVVSLAGAGGALGTLVRLVRHLHGGRYDVVEAYGFRATLLARAATLLGGSARLVAGIRAAQVIDTIDPDDRRVGFVLWVLRTIAPAVAAFAVNSEGSRKVLAARGLPARKLVVTLNGVDTDVPQADPGSGASVRIVCVARFVPFKNHELLVRAFAAARAGGADMRLTLVGHGPLVDAVRAQIADLRVADRVELTGRLDRDGVRGVLASSHVSTLVSMPSEGLPGSVLEAMAAGLPVIGSDIPGTRELIDDGVTGLLVPVNDVEATAAAISRLASDPLLRRQMGAEGRRRALEGHSWERLVREKEELYLRIAGVQP